MTHDRAAKEGEGRELGKRIEIFLSRDMGVNPGAGVTQRTMFDTLKEAIERWEATQPPQELVSLREALRSMKVIVDGWTETADSIDDNTGVTACSKVAAQYRERAMEMRACVSNFEAALTRGEVGK